MVHADGKRMFGATLRKQQVSDAMPCNSHTASARAALLGALALPAQTGCHRPYNTTLSCCDGRAGCGCSVAPVALELSAAKRARPVRVG
eukprot:6205752-Pleurochrysis_carterae.AAC.3